MAVIDFTTRTIVAEAKMRPCASTIEALEILLKRAKAGEIVGLSFAAIKRGHECTYGVAGVAYDDPIFAIGATMRLIQHLNGGIDRKVFR